LNRKNPKKRNAKKPINAIRMFKIFPRTPPRPINTKKSKMNPNNAISSHNRPVKNPRKIPKMPQ
jgi:hypothetical protein